MDEVPKTWVDGKLVDLTDERRDAMAKAMQDRWIEPPAAQTTPRAHRTMRQRIIDTLIGADNPAYPYVEMLVSWGWVPFAALIAMGAYFSCQSPAAAQPGP